MSAPIDYGRLFMPERFTPLFHTAAYATLDEAQRRRYNQLHASCLTEQILFFETSLTHTFLPPLLAEPLAPAQLMRIRRFMADEERHIEMFRRLNRRAAPQWYASSDFHFIRVPAWPARLFAAAARRPRRFPLFVWIMLIQEERSAHHAREFVRQADVLEPHFVRAHRAHLADEVHHVDWDEELLDLLWAQAPPRRRVWNARLFAWLIGEFFNTPKRAGLRVLRALVAEHPGLAPRLPELERAVRDLARAPAYHEQLYSRAIVPRTFAAFDRWPEFGGLGRVLLGYSPVA